MALLNWCLRLGVVLCLCGPALLASLQKMHLYHLTGQQGDESPDLPWRARRSSDLNPNESNSSTSDLKVCNNNNNSSNNKNNNNKYACVCTDCKKTTSTDSVGVKCCKDSMPSSWLRETVLIQLYDYIIDKYLSQESDIKTVLAETVRRFCTYTSKCPFKPELNLDQVLVADNVIVVHLNSSASSEADWVGLGFIVLIPSDSIASQRTRNKRDVDHLLDNESGGVYNINNIGSPRHRRETHTAHDSAIVALQSQVVISAVEYDQWYLSDQLGVQVGPNARQLWPKLGVAEPEGGFKWTVRNLVGVSAAGLLAAILVPACFVSAFKACRDRTIIKKRNQIKREERQRRRAAAQGKDTDTEKEKLTPNTEPDKVQIHNDQQPPGMTVEETEPPASEHVITATIHCPQDTANLVPNGNISPEEGKEGQPGEPVTNGVISNGVLPDGTKKMLGESISNGHVPKGGVANGQVAHLEEQAGDTKEEVKGLEVPASGVDNLAYDKSPTTPP